MTSQAIKNEQRLQELTDYLWSANAYAYQSTSIIRAISFAEKPYDSIFEYIWAGAYTCTLMNTAKLFDEHQGALSVSKMLSRYQVPKYESQRKNLLSEWAEIRRPNKALIKKIIDVRNEAMAHLDLNLKYLDPAHVINLGSHEALLGRTIKFLEKLPWRKGEVFRLQGPIEIERALGLEPRREFTERALEQMRARGLI